MTNFRFLVCLAAAALSLSCGTSSAPADNSGGASGGSGSAGAGGSVAAGGGGGASGGPASGAGGGQAGTGGATLGGMGGSVGTGGNAGNAGLGGSVGTGGNAGNAGTDGGLTGGRVTIYFDAAIPQHAFAAQETKAAFERRGIGVDIAALADLGSSAGKRKVVIADSANSATVQLLQKEGAAAAGTLGAQAYVLRTTGTGSTLSYWAIGGEPVGTMYGGLQIAESVDQSEFGSVLDASKTPYIAQRGIKFNIPLDARTPSYSDDSDSAQANIAEVWSMDFWKSYFDQMARGRYNLLSLWSLNPFPSLVKVPEFPNVSLADVKKPTQMWDANTSGPGMFNSAWTLATVKTMTIDEKIAFWQAVMQYAKDRGVRLYIFTWNIFTYGTENSGYGITDLPTNLTTQSYYRAAVRTLFQTYPLLAGIGITAGENLGNGGEQWMWNTYGQGFSDAKNLDPTRDMHLIHRSHYTDPGTITPLFSKLPGYADADSSLAFSFKYSQAHVLSSTKPLFINSWIGTMPAGKKTWLTVRTDDLYYMRWGDPDFVRAYIQNMPAANKLAGFYMGPDGYTWGREALSKNPDTPRKLVIEKMWYGWQMWGKLGFDPTTPNSEFQQTLGARFPGVSSAALYNGFASVSKIVPLVTRFYWGDLDFKWYPEACWSIDGFETVTNFSTGKYVPMGVNDGDSPGLLSVAQSLGGAVSGKLTAIDVAALLQTYADEGAAAIAQVNPGSDKELAETLGDVKAMAHLGRYYAEKILGAVELAKNNKPGAVVHLTAASGHWKDYAAQLTSQYASGQVLTRMGNVRVDFNTIQASVDNDIKLAGGP